MTKGYALPRPHAGQQPSLGVDRVEGKRPGDGTESALPGCSVVMAAVIVGRRTGH